jgi:hypothetical protein
MVVVSNTATVLTGTAWSNGTPIAGAAYIVGPGAQLGTTARFADNWWQNLRLLYNPASL